MLIFYAVAVYLLRPEKGGIILASRQHATRTSSKASSVMIERQTLKGSVVSLMEEMMITRLTAITLTILFAAVSLTSRADAGASASAPTKNSHSSQVAAHQNGHKTAKNDYGITEYSSSARRH